MYQVPVRVSESTIEGKGVFATAVISKGSRVWIFTEGHDIVMNTKEYNALPEKEKAKIKKTGYLSPWSGQWIFPPANDPAQFTNHSPNNNLSVVFDGEVSPEPFFIANRDIKQGEELTNNYHEFDKITQQTKPEWAT